MSLCVFFKTKKVLDANVLKIDFKCHYSCVLNRLAIFCGLETYFSPVTLTNLQIIIILNSGKPISLLYFCSHNVYLNIVMQFTSKTLLHFFHYQYLLLRFLKYKTHVAHPVDSFHYYFTRTHTHTHTLRASTIAIHIKQPLAQAQKMPTHSSLPHSEKPLPSARTIHLQSAPLRPLEYQALFSTRLYTNSMMDFNEIWDENWPPLVLLPSVTIFSLKSLCVGNGVRVFF